MPPQDVSVQKGHDLTRFDDGALRLRLDGDWKAGQIPISVAEIGEHIAHGAPSRMAFDADDLRDWDSGLPAFLLKIENLCQERGVIFDDGDLPPGVQSLLKMASSSPLRAERGQPPERPAFLERVAERAIGAWHTVVERLAFLGEVSVAFGCMVIGKGCFRGSDMLAIMQQTGARALPIVSLISLLVGLILAFVGAVQLSMFGAQIYVASLVAIAIVRVMGAIMTGIIMAGRTGAAFAAHLGTMQVNEEIDALSTLGIDPVEYLVLPRVLALSLMMPLLCLYADLMGILGGLIVGVFMLDLNVMEYLDMTRKAVQLKDFWVGLFHSAVFGVLVALVGCLRGMKCGRSAAAVGDATTSAVVSAIVNIIVATAIITVICNILGI